MTEINPIDLLRMLDRIVGQSAAARRDDQIMDRFTLLGVRMSKGNQPIVAFFNDLDKIGCDYSFDSMSKSPGLRRKIGASDTLHPFGSISHDRD